jgi:hypothetical protein
MTSADFERGAMTERPDHRLPATTDAGIRSASQSSLPWGASPFRGHGDYAATVLLADPLFANLSAEVEVLHGETKSGPRPSGSIEVN